MTSETTDEDNDQTGVKADHFEKGGSPLPPDSGENPGADEYLSSEVNAFNVFDQLWAAADPRRAPRLLTEPAKQATNSERERIPLTTKRSVQPPQVSNTPANAISATSFTPTDTAGVARTNPVREMERLDAFNRRAAVPLEILPFHHLISFAPLASVPAQMTLPPAESAAMVGDAEARRQLCWQALAANGIPVREAALFDDALRCRLNEYAEKRITETDWTVIYHDALAGCAEIYRAELLFWKRRVYEAGDDLRTFVEIKETDLLAYFNGTALTNLSGGRITQLFLDSLNASFTLDVRSAATGKDGALPESETAAARQRTRRWTSSSGPFDEHYSTGGGRIGFWIYSDGDEEGGGESPGGASRSEDRIFRIELSDYWLRWQRAARAAAFDFDYLETITDARALRFYELTKLRRVSPEQSSATTLPTTMTIAYAALAALLPLPRLHSERRINEQLARIIEPLKNGYVRSFAFRTDSSGAAERSPQIVFRFDD